MTTISRQPTVLGLAADAVPGRFRTLQYQPLPGERWYHILFGHVPRYQMEFILRPELPYRKFRPQHFAHLGPQIKFLSPSPMQNAAFAIGNLSSNDTQHIPGRGGLSLLVTTRVAELRDHAQRESPVFAHGLVAVDELMVEATLAQTLSVFLQHVLQEGQGFYRGYYTSGQADNLDRVQGYIRSLRDLPVLDDDNQPAAVFVQYIRDEPPPYNQILVDCRQIDVSRIVALMARLAVLLYRSNLKWSTVTTGSEPFEPRLHQGADFGVGVRLLCEGVSDEAIERHLRDAQPQSRAVLLGQDDLPSDDDELAARLFGASVLRPVPSARPAPADGDGPASAWQPISIAGGGADAHGSSEDPTLAFAAIAGLDALHGGPKDTDREHPAIAVHAEPVTLVPLAERSPTPDAARLPSGPPPAPSAGATSRSRPALWLAVGGFVGALAGAIGTWQGMAFRGGPATPATAGSPDREAVALPSGRRGHAEPQPLSPAPRLAADAERSPPRGPDDDSLEARQALARAVQQQLARFSQQASVLRDGLARKRSTGGALSAPYQKLATTTERLQQAVDQLDHVATAITMAESAHRLIGLTDSYCDARSVYQQAKSAGGQLGFDVSNSERDRVNGSKP